MSDDVKIKVIVNTGLGKLTCPICQVMFIKEPNKKVGYCPGENCNRPVHVECWEYNDRRCGNFGCNAHDRGLLDVGLASAKMLQETKISEFRLSIQKKDTKAILTIFFQNREFLVSCKEFSRQDWEVVRRELTNFRNAFLNEFSRVLILDEDQTLINLVEKYSTVVPLTELTSSETIERLKKAKDRINALENLNNAIRSENQVKIWSVYKNNQKIIDSTRELYKSSEMLKLIKNARLSVAQKNYKRARRGSNPALLISTAHEFSNSGGQLGSEEYEEISRLLEDENIFSDFNNAIAQNEEEKIAMTWDVFRDRLENRITDEQKKRAEQAINNIRTIARVKLAIVRNDFLKLDELFVDVDKRLLTAEELEKSRKMLHHASILKKFNDAISRKDASLTLTIYDEVDSDMLGRLPIEIVNSIEEFKMKMLKEKELENLWKAEKYAEFVEIYQKAINQGVPVSQNSSLQDKFFRAQFNSVKDSFINKHNAM